MKKLLLLVCLAFSFLFANAQETYKKETFTSKEGFVLPYRSLEPQEIKDGKKYPLVLFLHGSGERGNDNEKQLTHGSQQFLNPVAREKHPSYVIFPQCPQDVFWAYGDTPDYEHGVMKAPKNATNDILAVIELVNSYLASGKVDPKRVYVMGLSMGGMATFDILIRYPDLFAAAIPICGAVDVERMTAKPTAKIRIFHGDSDGSVPVWCSRNAYVKLKEIGAKVGYKEYPGSGHGCWNQAFNEPDFLDWLYSQHR